MHVSCSSESFNNSIGAEGVARLAVALPQCRSLADLDLGNNSIGEEGASRLAAVLGQCTSLVHLKLWRNFIGVEVVRLAAALPQCRSLANLDLGLNSMRFEGAVALVEVLGNARLLYAYDLT